jgi:hypothetical protein
MKRNYPGGVKYLIFLTFLIGVWNLIRFLATISFWNLLSEYEIKGGPLFIAISGAVWMIVAFYVGFSVLQAKPWSWGMSLGLLSSYGLWILFDQMVFHTTRINQNFELIITLLWLVMSGIVLSSKYVRNYFHEQSREN